MRLFEVGDIVRDRRLDELLAEWQKSNVGLYEVREATLFQDATGPIAVHLEDGEIAVQQRIRICRVGATGATARLVGEWATVFGPKGSAFELVQTVEERLAEELMR